MGDRANFGVKQGNDTVYLYGHWAGYGMMSTLANALDKVKEAGRLDDEAYATRIMFSQIVGEAWTGGLGWGITVNYIGDNEHKVPVVDFRVGSVTLYEYEWTTQGSGLGRAIFTQSIDNFIKRYAKDLTSA